MLEVVSLNAYEEGIDFGRVAIEFFGKRVLGPLLGS